MDITQYFGSQGLFIKAFQPLQVQLNQQAKDLWNNAERKFSPWLIKCGKGSSQYLDYPDISLYRHCMDVAILSSYLFIHAWQQQKIPNLTPDDEKQAEQRLKQLFAISFSHDADKYTDSKSQSPSLEDVNQVHQDLNIIEWANLDSTTLHALVSRVESRGLGNVLLSNTPSNDLRKLAEMVQIADKLLSIASRKSYTAFLSEYNLRLKQLHNDYGIPKQPLKLLTVNKHPIILHYLLGQITDDLYEQGILPLIAQISGEQLWVSLPENYDLASTINKLQKQLSEEYPTIKRNQTNGTTTINYIYNILTLVDTIIEPDQFNPLFLVIHKEDWEIANAYIQSWAGEIGDLSLPEPKENQKIRLAVTPNSEHNFPIRYHYALAISASLSIGADKSEFESRISTLKQYYPDAFNFLNQHFLDNPLWQMNRHSQQTLIAMQLSKTIPMEKQALYELIELLKLPFPEPQEDLGVIQIINNLRQQCGLTPSEQSDLVEPYTFDQKWGYCLLSGEPSQTKIETKLNLIAIKSSAFSDRFGHKKSLWSPKGNNYISEAVKVQERLMSNLASQTKIARDKRFQLIAMPTRHIIKSVNNSSFNKFTLIKSYDAITYKQATWMRVLPWNTDIDDSYHILLEPITDTKIDKIINHLLRLAMLALQSGDAIHVFNSKQYDNKGALFFEPMPALLKILFQDLMSSTEPYVIRRDKLKTLIIRLDVIKNLFSRKKQFDALPWLAKYGWWTVAWATYKEKPTKFNGNYLANLSWQDLINKMQQEYNMTETIDISIDNLAYLASRIQRKPNSQSESVKTLALTTALNSYQEGERRQRQSQEIIAAMANQVASYLSRREQYIGSEEGGNYSQRCERFAQAVYEFVKQNDTDQQPFDARFQRFMLAAYTHLFIKHTEQYNKERKAEKSTHNQTDKE